MENVFATLCVHHLAGKFLPDFTVKFVYSEKATKFCEIFPLLLSEVHTDKSKVDILQNFVTFSEYVNFTMYSSKN